MKSPASNAKVKDIGINNNVICLVAKKAPTKTPPVTRIELRPIFELNKLKKSPINSEKKADPFRVPKFIIAFNRIVLREQVPVAHN